MTTKPTEQSIDEILYKLLVDFEHQRAATPPVKANEFIAPTKEALLTEIEKAMPEKKTLKTDEPLDAMDEGEKFCVECGQWEYEGVLNCKCVGYNQALTNTLKAIRGIFNEK